MVDDASLPQLRSEIERVDKGILSLLKERMKVVEGIARTKLSLAVAFRDPSREEQVLQRVRKVAVELELDTHEIERLYRLIMEMSIARQQAYVRTLDTVPLRVAFQGTEGSYSQLAAQQRYAERPGGVLLQGFDTLRQTVAAVVEGQVDCALLPIENTTAGSMNETYDLLAEGGITLTGEVIAQLHHRLLALPGATLSGIRTVLSHPQALSQCGAFLKTLKGVRFLPELDTAGSARKVKEGNDRSVAAIASEPAAALFGLHVLADDLHAEQAHYTRYVEVSREATPCPDFSECKTSLLLVLEHRPGALGEVLVRFGRHGVNLSKLESRPIPGSSWKYQFYLDVEGHAASREVVEALDGVRPLTTELRVLGTYPRAKEPA